MYFSQNWVDEENKKDNSEVVAAVSSTITTFTIFFISCFDPKRAECSHYLITNKDIHYLLTDFIHYPHDSCFIMLGALKNIFPFWTLSQYLDIPLGWSQAIVDGLLQIHHLGSPDPWFLSSYDHSSPSPYSQ